MLIEPLRADEIEAHELGDSAQAISAMSVAELHDDMLLARGDAERSARLRRLATIEAAYDALPFDTGAARVFGRCMAEAKRGRARRRARDAIIAATAETYEFPVLTRDADFDRFDAAAITVPADE